MESWTAQPPWARSLHTSVYLLNGMAVVLVSQRHRQMKVGRFWYTGYLEGVSRGKDDTSLCTGQETFRLSVGGENEKHTGSGQAERGKGTSDSGLAQKQIPKQVLKSNWGTWKVIPENTGRRVGGGKAADEDVSPCK